MNFDRKIFRKMFDFLNTSYESLKNEADIEVSVYKEMFKDQNLFWKRVMHNYSIYMDSNKGINDIHLDYGSGWGFFPFCLSGFGVKKVIGIEMKNESFFLSEKIRKKLFSKRDIVFINSSVLDYKEDVDVIYFNNVISHVKLPIEYLMDAYNKLSYSGTLVLYDNNNAFSLKVQMRNRRLWNRNEDQLVKERIEIIRKLGVDVDNLEVLGKYSKGLAENDIVSLFERHKNDIHKIINYLDKREKNLPTQFISPPIVDERIINPIIYKSILLQMGFECITLKSVSFNHQLLAKLLGKIGLLVLPAFQIVAEKRRLSLKN